MGYEVRGEDSTFLMFLAIPAKEHSDWSGLVASLSRVYRLEFDCVGSEKEAMLKSTERVQTEKDFKD